MDIGALGLYVCLFFTLYFEVFLLISFVEKPPTAKNKSLPRHYPFVSMIVPCFNEEKTLEKSLASLLALSYPKDKLEIVVVDDGSKDATAAIAAQFAEAYPKQVISVSKKNGGKYTALNIGIEHAQGEIIGCLDADSFVAEDALLEAAKLFEKNPEIMAVTPSMHVYRPRTLLELMQSVEYTFGIFIKKIFDNLSAINVLPGPFSLYRREVFERIGGFRHAHNTEDMEMAFRMHANGLIIANAHTAVVHTTAPSTLRGLLKQRVRWSQGFLQNSLDYSYLYFNRRFGNFGMLVLPFSLISFFAALYMVGYLLARLLTYVVTHTVDMVATQVPPQLPSLGSAHWYALQTNMSIFLVAALISMTFVAILIGQRIGNAKLTTLSFVAYFAFFGFLAPVWLARAAWGALLSRESTWR